MHYNLTQQSCHGIAPRGDRPQTPKKEQRVSSVVVNVRLPAEDFEATKRKAEREERAVSAVIRRALKIHLDDDREPERPAAC